MLSFDGTSKPVRSALPCGTRVKKNRFLGDRKAGLLPHQRVICGYHEIFCGDSSEHVFRHTSPEDLWWELWSS